ncbi:MAG: GNAT family N-acetyltransferase [Actinomycetota bacterium]|nr:GNAT family N-acetyltransferase [Actinomycetota bacterium]
MSVGKRLRLERLGEHHDVSGFASGNTELDKWLQHHALAAQAMNSARTFVLLRDDTVVGYFSLTLASVRREDAPTRLVRGLPAYPVGMVLVARLAVAAAEQGAGLGAGLLSAALRKAAHAGEIAAARLVLVDAIDDSAAAFYRRHGFTPVPENPLRLYRRMKEIRASLAQARA